MQYYIRQMRIKAYTQLLESYRSLSLSHMAATFGVSVQFIDRELSQFIASGRLHCKIDKVGGVVVTMRPDSKNFQYQVWGHVMSCDSHVTLFYPAVNHQAGRPAVEQSAEVE